MEIEYKITREDNLVINAVDLIYALQNNGFDQGLHYLPTHHDCFNFGAHARIPSAREVCQLRWQKNINDSQWTSVRAVYLYDDWKGENYKTLNRAINDIREKTVAPIYVFGPKMVYSKYADIILGSIKSINPDDINEYAQRFTVKAEREGLNSRLKNHFNQAIYSEADVHYIDLLDLQAPYELVSIKTAKLLYFDSGHFTKDGSTEMGEKLKARYPNLF